MQRLPIIALLLLALVNVSGQLESDFFADTTKNLLVIDLVEDYHAIVTDENDDSNLLQSAIDNVSAAGGGKVILQKGTYILTGILLKDNVHIVIDSGTLIRPPVNTGVIFALGLTRKGVDAEKTIRNVSIRGNGGSYIVDLRSGIINEKLWFANCRNVENFMVADFHILDHYTKMSGVTVNVAWNGDNYYMARNGVIKNGDVENAHVGYGLIQVQCGQHILFKNLAGQGGVTLRLESGAIDGTPDYIKIDDVWGRKISSRYGSSCFIMGSHTKQNGYVNIKNAYSFSSGFGGGIGKGFVTEEEAAAGLTPGHFSPDSEVDSVHAVFGYGAQVKWKNWDVVPCPIRHLISEEKGPDNESYIAPSITAMKWNDKEISLTNVTYEGFYFNDSIIDDSYELPDCPEDYLNPSAVLFEQGTESGSLNVDVSSNKEWVVEETADWLDVTPDTGRLDESIEIVYAENTITRNRSASIYLSAGSLQKEIVVAQSGVPEVLTLSADQLNAAYEADALNFDITTNTEWTIAYDADWLTVTPLSGTGNETVQLTFTKNVSTEERSVVLQVSGIDISDSLTLTQAGSPVGVKLDVWPNPGSDLMFINTDVKSSWQIISPSGQVLKRSDNEDFSFDLSLEGIEKGMYFLRVSSEKGSCVEPIIVQ